MSVLSHVEFSPSRIEQAGSRLMDESSGFFEKVELALCEAVETVRGGKALYAFLNVLTEEEKRFFNALSGQQVALSFRALGIDVNFEYDYLKIAEDEKNPAVQRASVILTRIIQMLDVHKISMDKFASARLNVPNWHTDTRFQDTTQNLILDQEERCGIRMTWVLKGPATQVFVPTKSEYEQLCSVSRAGQRVFDAIQKITDTDPARVMKGNNYDLLVFHRGTIHKGFSSPSPDYPDRIVFTAFDDQNLTPPIKVQYMGSPGVALFPLSSVEKRYVDFGSSHSEKDQHSAHIDQPAEAKSKQKIEAVLQNEEKGFFKKNIC